MLQTAPVHTKIAHGPLRALFSLFSLAPLQPSFFSSFLVPSFLFPSSFQLSPALPSLLSITFRPSSPRSSPHSRRILSSSSFLFEFCCTSYFFLLFCIR